MVKLIFLAASTTAQEAPKPVEDAPKRAPRRPTRRPRRPTRRPNRPRTPRVGTQDGDEEPKIR
eukprot:2037196-Pyramimonas_sp.AAC.1